MLSMCLLQCNKRSLKIKRHTERVGQRDSTSEFGLDFRYSDVCEKTLVTKGRSEKSMNVSDVQVSDEDGVIRANLNDDSQFANKIAKERIWTITSPFRQENNKIVTEQIWINPVTSKILKQSLESDNDSQLHK